MAPDIGGFPAEIQTETSNLNLKHKGESIELGLKHKITLKDDLFLEHKVRDFYELETQVFFPLQTLDFPEDKEYIYLAIHKRYPIIPRRDIVLLQYYPCIAVNRMKESTFIDKTLHAVFSPKIEADKLVERIYFLDRANRKTTSIDIPKKVSWKFTKRKQKSTKII